MIEENQSTFNELKKAFGEGFNKFISGFKAYIQTSIAISTYHLLSQDSRAVQDKYLSNSKYAYRVFEYILVFLFLTKLFAIGEDLEESMEVLQDIFVLIFYFITLLGVIVLGKIARATFLKKISGREVEAHFIYAFSFLFLPCYVLLYFGIDTLDDIQLDGLSNLLVLSTSVFLWIYFYKMSRKFGLSKIKSVSASFLMAVTLAVFLFLSLSLVVGAGYLES